MKQHNIFFLIYDQVEVLDFTGPFDVFSMANIVNRKKIFNLYTVSPDGDQINTIHNLKLIPDFSIEDCPITDIDILVIPGGLPPIMLNFENEYPEVLHWINECYQHVNSLVTVCVGSLIAAKSGVLNGLNVTSHHNFLDHLREYTDSNTKVINGVRYVFNKGEPNIITSAGVSSGIDMAFFILSMIEGKELMYRTQNIMEYNLTKNWIYE